MSVLPSRDCRHFVAIVSRACRPKAVGSSVPPGIRKRESKMVLDGMSKTVKSLVYVGVILFCFGIGIIIGYAVGAKEKQGSATSAPDYLRDEDRSITKKIVDEVKAQNIRDNLYNWTRKPQLAGTEEDQRGAQRLHDIWKNEHKLDSVTMTRYNVLLSYPSKERPSVIQKLTSSGSVVFTSRAQEEDITPGQPLSPDAVPPFHAYAKSGDVTGDLVYANYARIEDLDALETYLRTKGDTITGKIVICRYGRLGRMDKVTNAAQRKAKGMIIYTDPMEFAKESDKVYPHSWWMPPSGVQRGTVFDGNGDPLTPFYPAIDSAYRLPLENATNLPLIPSLPIGYADAATLMGDMTGDEVPAVWKGNMNITYRYGPGNANGIKVRLYINNSREIRPTYNVIGVIRGSVEPDRYVLMGNHRDAWVYGAVDPTSGTASMVELSRTFSELVRTGWRPRRSLVFCSWGAEEYGLIGSNEWVEEYTANLVSRSVAYINVDVAVEGNNSIRVLANPILNQAVYAATKKIPTPEDGATTLYDKWLKSIPSDDDPNIPAIYSLDAGSDHASFFHKVGIPCVDLCYTYDEKGMNIASYLIYHSAYETFYLMEKHMDPGFKRHRAVTQLWGELARSLADALILPLNVTAYAETIAMDFDVILKQYQTQWNQHGVNVSGLQDAINSFKRTAATFMKLVNSVDRSDPFAVRRINDQLMLLERAFIDPLGLPGRPTERHLIFAPSLHDTYAGDSFPGLGDTMWAIDKDPNVAAKYELVKKHVSVLAFIIQSAARTLVETHTFPR